MSKFSLVPIVRGFVGDFSEARLKVRRAYASPDGRWTYRRLGYEFSKEAIEIPLTELGTNPVEVAEKIVRLATDQSSGAVHPTLHVELALPDEHDRNIDPISVAELSAFVAARGVWPE